MEGSFLGGDAWNWDSPDQVKQVFAARGIPLEKTDDAALAAINHPLAELVRQYRSVQKRASTYGLDWYGEALHGDRVHAGWRQIGADSGRMACSSPNLQNLPATCDIVDASLPRPAASWSRLTIPRSNCGSRRS